MVVENMKEEEEVLTAIRLPKSLYDVINKIAEDTGESPNDIIVTLLTIGLTHLGEAVYRIILIEDMGDM